MIPGGVEPREKCVYMLWIKAPLEKSWLEFKLGDNKEMQVDRSLDWLPDDSRSSKQIDRDSDKEGEKHLEQTHKGKLLKTWTLRDHPYFKGDSSSSPSKKAFISGDGLEASSSKLPTAEVVRQRSQSP
ncbi:hypothetical protein LIER_14349 [Lithospermum erythrorhizon]|uniref:Uncharacterized protein n=1 Tax=Lithospermum erythrorhizon TaxID=34254 RepID=A0AAV3PYZ7_LITER